jgi:hypothetical protein
MTTKDQRTNSPHLEQVGDEYIQQATSKLFKESYVLWRGT